VTFSLIRLSDKTRVRLVSSRDRRFSRGFLQVGGRLSDWFSE
jgi:hypothetical protein